MKQDFEVKKCTKCLELLPLGKFYSKGKRRDSECKQCRKSRSKTKYVATRTRDGQLALKQFINAVIDLEIEKLSSLNQRMLEIARKYSA